MAKPQQPNLFQIPIPLTDGTAPLLRASVSEPDLLALAVELGARDVAGWTTQEDKLTRDLPRVPRPIVAYVAELIGRGRDPLGDLFCQMRTGPERRPLGATYTPHRIVHSMLDWAQSRATPERVVDPGTGSARFLVASGRRYEKAGLVGVDIDPVATILARAHLAAAGLRTRSQIVLGDYRDLQLGAVDGRTLYLGNPPYVRHHLIESRWKAWLSEQATLRGLRVSQLAGLHLHFFLATVMSARKGDFGTFITAAEWLDVNYGRLLRDLFLNDLGGLSIAVIEPEVLPFTDAAATAAITCFEIGAVPRSVNLRRVGSVQELRDATGGHEIARERLAAVDRWSHLTRPSRRGPVGHIELGELCRVHRGQVTGLNRVWIAGGHSAGLPEALLYPSVTRASELFSAGRDLSDDSQLRRVIDIPVDLDVLDADQRRAVQDFLALAREMGADRGYVAMNRKAWWSVGLRDPAPILTTYMARRSPAFVRNHAAARHINIAHGLYPRVPLSEQALNGLVEYLSSTTSVHQGRTYAGGLTKFEPREIERLLVPDIQMLERGTV